MEAVCELILLRYTLILVNDDPCKWIGQIITANHRTTTSGEVKYPRYPGVYSNEMYCQWAIYVDQELLVKISFLELDLEAG